MGRLAWRDLVQSWSTWLCAGFICAATAWVTYPVATFFWSVAHRVPNPQNQVSTDQLLQVGVTLVTFYVLPAVLILATVMAVISAQQSVQHATWRLSGASPRQVRGTILTQAAILGGLSGAIGAASATLSVDATVGLIMGTLPQEELTATNHVVPYLATVTIIFAVAMMAATMPAWHASRASALVVLRPETSRQRLGWARWSTIGTTLGLFILPVAAMMITQAPALRGVAAPNARPREGALSLVDQVSGALIVALGLMFTAAIAAPRLTAPMLRAWTALIPGPSHPIWHLARATAELRVATATAAVTPLMIAITTLGAIASATQTITALTGTGNSADLQTAALTLMPPLTLAMLGSLAVLVMTSRHRGADITTLRTQGATKHELRRMLIWEATINATTALLFALAILGIQAALTAAVLAIADHPVGMVRIAWQATAAAYVTGVICMTAITGGTGLAAMRHRPATTLSNLPQ